MKDLGLASERGKLASLIKRLIDSFVGLWNPLRYGYN